MMAGGRGERMRASGVAVPKPLVSVAGATMLERNLGALVRDGWRDVVVAVPASEPSIGALVSTRGRDLLAAAGGRVVVFEETVPMGNMGAAAVLAGEADEVLVVYADNLTTLDLAAVVEHHRDEAAAYTLAAHTHTYRLPFGELMLDGDEVVDYREKPTWQSVVASAVSVLSPVALDAVRRMTGEGQAVGMVDLYHELRRTGAFVLAHRHEDPWVDVNDLPSVRIGEEMVGRNPDRCERWWTAGVRTVAAVVPASTVAIDDPAQASTGSVVIDDVVDGEPVRYVVRIADGDAMGELAPDVEADLPPGVVARAAFHLRRASLAADPPGGAGQSSR